MSWSFEDIKGGAYPYEVQNLEDAVEVGVLAYTSTIPTSSTWSNLFSPS